MIVDGIFNMITEDYVSFETAKLLKEKGFDEKVISFYPPGDIQRPTLQMAMKWIRVKGYQIIVKHTDDNGYFANILTMDNAHPVNKLFDGYNSYEQACEAAIKYCLENLI